MAKPRISLAVERLRRQGKIVSIPVAALPSPQGPPPGSVDSLELVGPVPLPVEIEGRHMKACPTNESNQFDPDLDDRRVTAFRARRAYEYLYRRFPGLRGQPLVDTRVCQVTGNTDDHFLVDRHPSFDNVWLVGGGSGHGFKHGPALGDYVARRVLDNAGDPEYDAAFAL